MGPWGMVQNLVSSFRRKVRSRLYESLSPNIPFSGPVFAKGLSSDEKFAAVEQRMIALEFFLKEYVVGIDNVIKSDARVRDIEAPAEKDVGVTEN